MGHQMGGDHTFNGTRSTAAAATATGAPRSSRARASSIQAYAGICGSDNLQPHSDPYFSFHSIDQFEATTATVRTPTAERSRSTSPVSTRASRSPSPAPLAARRPT